MIPRLRLRREFLVRIGGMVLAAALVAGCSSSNTNGTGGSVNHITAQGTSVAGWLSASGASNHSRSATNSFIALGNAGGCTECHGADLLGGISRVSCMDNPSACHHGTVAEWVASGSGTQQHGASAKRGPGSSSMYACQICHGTDFRTDRGSVTCFTCHTLAPHPDRPWRSGGVDNTHVNVNTANAPVCFGCHADSPAGNVNNPHRPPTPAAPGTAPGCFNGTMCHNQAAAPHSTGSAWLTAGTGFHGTDAKADLTFCQGCHGTPGTINFNGGSAPTSCSPCHTAAKAHPTDWQGLRTINGVTITHRTSGNRDVACAICHKTTGAGAGPNPAAPSCFSANFTNASGQARPCHSGGPGSAPHALGSTWLDPAVGGAAFHGIEAKVDLLFCQTCHGTPGTTSFNGGSAPTSCSAACHTPARAHPTTWFNAPSPLPSYVASHRDSGNRNVACAVCHAVTGPGAGPLAGAPSCFTASFTNASGVAASCHLNGPSQPNHAVPFTTATHTQTTTSTFTADCGSCHAVTGTSPVSGAPLCTSCHVGDPRGVTNCSSCHGNPPTGVSTAYPNAAGAHSAHIVLNGAGTPITCSTCHNGLGSGTLSHYDRTRPPRVSPASVAFVTTYAAKTGAAAFDNSSLLRCTNVSCHGGQATPNWRTGTIDVVNACLSCHALGTAQYNSYNSGRHTTHTSQFGLSAATCKRCHDATKVNVTGHLTNLATATVFEQTARATLLTALQFNGTTCNPSAGGLSGCHGSENWQ